MSVLIITLGRVAITYRLATAVNSDKTETPIMDIKLCCHYCETQGAVRKHGKSRAGIPRYRCNACGRAFQTHYIYPGNETDIYRLIDVRLKEGLCHAEIASQLGIKVEIISRCILMLGNKY